MSSIPDVLFECDPGWHSTAAYRDSGQWTYGYVIVGGLGVGLVSARAAWVGIRHSPCLVTVPSIEPPSLPPNQSDGSTTWKQAKAFGILLLAFAISVAVNISYVAFSTATYVNVSYKVWHIVGSVI